MKTKTEKEFDLSKHREKHLRINAKETHYSYEEKFVKEFIKRQLDNISEEQKIAKGNDWKRSLLKLKADLETDAGEKLR